jgi:hypothetical protein
MHTAVWNFEAVLGMLESGTENPVSAHSGELVDMKPENRLIFLLESLSNATHENSVNSWYCFFLIYFLYVEKMKVIA